VTNAVSDLEVPLRVGGRTVADYVLAPDIDPTLVPRPYLHPVRTLAGTVVTDVLPADHEWHLGAGLAIADVAGSNLWGGRSYVHGKGYVRLPDHGRIVHVAWHRQSDDVLEHELVWRDCSGADLLAERRTLTAEPGPSAQSWTLTFSTTLTNVRPTPIEIRSPATNGRGEGAGYGGFFWRLPPTDDLHVAARDPHTAGCAQGEDLVNGSDLPELTISGETEGKAYALTVTGLGPTDRWFVRAAEYPALGVAFAYRNPVTLASGSPLARTFTVVVADC
jgi:hypothetical protein